MIELDPVGQRRVFVPSPGDSVKVCPECGSQTGILHASAKWLEDIDKEVYEHIALNYTTCCGMTPVLREVRETTLEEDLARHGYRRTGAGLNDDRKYFYAEEVKR